MGIGPSFAGSSAAGGNSQNAKEPKTLGPFLLGLILGIIGVIIAVIVYDDKAGPYTKNPQMHALIVSLLGMFIWIPIIIVFFLVLMAAAPGV
jgi:heme/copper-type cytochrome/quinol oxidase subunit 2